MPPRLPPLTGPRPGLRARRAAGQPGSRTAGKAIHSWRVRATAHVVRSRRGRRARLSYPAGPRTGRTPPAAPPEVRPRQVARYAVHPRRAAGHAARSFAGAIGYAVRPGTATRQAVRPGQSNPAQPPGQAAQAIQLRQPRPGRSPPTSRADRSLAPGRPPGPSRPGGAPDPAFSPGGRSLLAWWAQLSRVVGAAGTLVR